MNQKPNPSAADVGLRRRAVTRLQERSTTPTEVEPQRSKADTQRLLHELQVHQIELEMQNEELVQARAQAEASAEKFSALYDFAPIGYLSLDDRGLIQVVNLAAAKLLGKPRQALTGTPFVDWVSEPDKDTFRRHLRAASETDRKTTQTLDVCSGEGRIRSVEFCTICRRPAPGQPAHYQMAITDITKRKRAEKELHQLNTNLEKRVQQRTAKIRRLATELTLAEQRERSRLAQILHDNVQPLLVAARLRLDQIEPGSKGPGRQTVGNLQQLLAEALQTLRILSVELSPSILQKDGLAAALTWLGTWMREKHGLTVEVATVPKKLRLSEEVGVLLYQSVRELLLNVVKHAQVTSARVNLDEIDRQLEIVVSDEGKGFDAANPQPPTSIETFGLSAVRDRLALLGGQLEILSAPGCGSRFTLRAPLRRPRRKPMRQTKEVG